MIRRRRRRARRTSPARAAAVSSCACRGRDPSRRRIDELPRQRRDAGQPLHEVERGPFGRQQRRGMPANLGDRRARLAERAVARD